MAKRNRDDFTKGTVLQIAKRAGWRCSFPTCRKDTVGATSDDEGDINIGTAAHICAAAPGGPRYDETMSPEERSSVKNGIWMCRDHGKAIDSSDPEFTVERLREWKKQAEYESRRRVLHNEAALGQADVTDRQLAERMRAAAEADLKVFRQTAKWPFTSVALTLKMDDFDEPVTTSALAGAVISLDDLILVAPPGMGKTTTLFQIAESVLANGKGTPIVVPLGDWATEGAAILDSILKRPAFRGISEDDFRKAGAQPGVVLLLDGWNELDAGARTRARVQITTLKAELPELGLIVSTRRQALDVPFAGTRVDLLPLNEGQQMQIAVAMRGDVGAKIVDQAWRTPGVRELVTIPLYLTALLSLPDSAPFPTTKEEVLRRFVAMHEKDASHAETLYAVAQGFQQDYLDGLAVFATRTANTAIADSNARRSISETENLLVDNGQITIKPQPDAVLNVLVSNHVLMRAGDTPGYSFQHQQFQEWYASHSVESRIMAEVADPKGRETLKAEVFNLPAWEEPILFAVERLARGDVHQCAACGKAILAAFEVDPILAAEMIFRSTEEVWSRIAATIQGLVARWHAPGKVDRAVRFMLTSGRPEFLDSIWPLITDENEQISLKALRNCRRFRPSILGHDAEKRIKDLSPRVRTVLLSEMVSRSGMDGLDLASAIAKNDPDPEVQASVVETLAFRRADRHVAEVLQNAGDKTFDLIARRDLIDEVDDEQVKKGVAAARKRQAAENTSASDRLRVIVYAQGSEDRSAELTEIISTMEIKQHQDPAAQFIYEARNRYLGAVADGLMARVRAGRTLFYGADDILASAGLALEDDSLLELALSDPGDRHNDRAEAAASVLGPIAVGRMVDALLEAGSRLRVDGKFDQAGSEIYGGLQARIAHVPGASLVAAVLARSAQADNEQMARLAELLSQHPNGDTDRGRPFGPSSLAAIQDLAEDWGSRMLASGDAQRWQKASIATLASHAPSVGLLPTLKRLLDDNLQRYRAFREEAKTAGWRQGEALNEARQPMTHEYQRAFLAIKAPETAGMMQEYLQDEYFGELAAQVLADQWRTANEPAKDKRFHFGVDFSGVEEKRAARAVDPDATSAEAETIFAAIESLIADGATDEQKRLAVALGIVASRLPHGQRDSTIQKLIALAPRRARSDLLLGLVLSGEKIDAKTVGDGICETLEAAKTEPWILTQSDGYELKSWLRLLPFVNHPTEALAIVRGMPPAQREPRFLEEMIGALAEAPSGQAEEVLFKLAEEDPRFYSNERWRATALRFGTPSSARQIVDLAAGGAFDGIGNDWHLAQELSSLIRAHPDLRSRVYTLLKDGPTTPGLATLAHAVAEAPDDDGALLLIKFEQEMKRAFVTWHTIERVVTERVPTSDWAGAFNVVPVPASSLRQKLLALTTDGGPTDHVARWLREIDWIRDEHGMPEAEPRHPDLASGKPWPIMQPDPHATADG
ncbi:NACHT domain-containing protein [Burkholderia multivorans]|uniref:NACHT domain-containing protein n=1 Tax=Burkholderia multivorans TaxID=87883 RepID=UPI001239D94E|nr:hypothetical protein [Burkholderia multivorans]MBU9247682.1 hypothetical protein [Burkholderia multivorans]QET31708.1 hypothetical protein FOB31_18835 [Burkholderia multivorans]QET40872.1 hypothetical protein FOB30_25025 [Burkholderia multivorans]